MSGFFAWWFFHDYVHSDTNLWILIISCMLGLVCVYFLSLQSRKNTNINVSTRSKNIAGLLAIFLGTFGIHKIYLQKKEIGAVYLLFFWTGIPTIIGIVEGIVIFAISDTDFNKKYNLQTNDNELQGEIVDYPNIMLSRHQCKANGTLDNHVITVCVNGERFRFRAIDGIIKEYQSPKMQTERKYEVI